MTVAITIVDYGVGNLGSVANMLKKIGVPFVMASGSKDIERAEKLILPGVGAFDAGMNALNASGYRDVLAHKALVEKVPVLGICLGMQLLARDSEEGKGEGLGWIPASVKRFQFSAESPLKIPHMGWNNIQIRRDGPLFDDLRNEPDLRFYFVHSYHVVCDDPNDRIATTDYGGEFTSMLSRGNIYAAQFHPEKSHRFGMRLFRNFAAIEVARC